LDALEVDARDVIEGHWGQVRAYVVELLRHQGIDEVVAEELALLPGADELATLVSVEDHATSGQYDLIIVDCAPTGSALRLVTLPEVAHSGFKWLLRLQRAAATIAEPIASGLVGAPLPKAEVFAEAERLLYKTLEQLRARLLSKETSIRLVVTPETMVIDEARRSLTDLALFELASDAVVMNRVWPDEALREEFFRDWGRSQEERLRDVETHFAPMAMLVAPLQADEVCGFEALAAHGEALFAGLDPIAVLGTRPGLRFERNKQQASLRLPMNGRDAKGVQVLRVDDELVIGVESRRRRIPLPAALASLEVERVFVEGGELVVTFANDPDLGTTPGEHP
jgi:arsenite-transporting ATPase